jgi:uncharacterized protein (TIGR02145 family)
VKSRNYRFVIIAVLFTAVNCESIHTVIIPPPATITDIDGNIYKTITIGTQVWLKENLKTTRYNNGKAIPLITEDKAWGESRMSEQSAYCWYNNDTGIYKSTYGALYNCFTVDQGNLCPTGWHVPSDEEWTTLINFIGGYSTGGGILKETGYIHWDVPNIGATNYWGFTAVPGGYRFADGKFFGISSVAHWWSASDTEYDDIGSFFYVSFNGAYISLSQQLKVYGFSVRCIMD